MAAVVMKMQMEMATDTEIEMEIGMQIEMGKRGGDLYGGWRWRLRIPNIQYRNTTAWYRKVCQRE